MAAPPDEITVLVGRLHETQQRLQELTGGEVDAVVVPGGHSYLLHEAQEKLRASEERFRLIYGQLTKVLDSSLDVICSFDAEGRFLQVSAACGKVWGYLPAELLGTPYIDKVLPEDQPKTRAAAVEVMAGISTTHFENRYLRKDGSIAHIMWSASWSQTDQNMVCVARDISEAHRSEARIAEQATLIDEARDAIFLRDLEHRVTFWNKGAERLFGWTAAEAEGRDIHDLLQPDTIVFDEALTAVLREGAWNGEIQNGNKSGARLTLESRWTLVRDAQGQPKSILVIDTDITARKKIELQFLRSQRMESIGTLAGGIAHDLNNSLGPIILSLELLMDRFTDDDSQDLLEILRSSAQRGAAMVQQVLSFARGVEGERREVQIRHLVGEIAKIIDDTFLKHIQVRTSIPGDLHTVLGDATQIHQVLLNLCVNARDAMPDGGKLKISAKNLQLDAHYAGLNPDAKSGSYVCLEVEDSGTGISPDLMEKIFDPFFTTKEVGKGTGLGLSTSLAIVKSHGGFFRAYSEPGNGTKFSVFLPSLAETSCAVLAEESVPLPRGGNELILVVDDEESVRQITQRTLEAYGYRVLLAGDGVEAIALYAAQSPEIAVVLTDMTMPIMDGPRFLAVLWKINPKARVIGSSGLAVGSQSGLASEHFLQKPYSAKALLTALKRILAGKP